MPPCASLVWRGSLGLLLLGEPTESTFDAPHTRSNRTIACVPCSNGRAQQHRSPPPLVPCPQSHVVSPSLLAPAHDANPWLALRDVSVRTASAAPWHAGFHCISSTMARWLSRAVSVATHDLVAWCMRRRCVPPQQQETMHTHTQWRVRDQQLRAPPPGPEKPKTLVASNWYLLLAIAGNCCWQLVPVAGNCWQQANVLASCAAVAANRCQSLPHYLRP